MTNGNSTITSANSVFTLAAAGLFPVPQQLSGYSAERAWESEAYELSESQMGVDGRHTAGWVPSLISMTVSLQADSPAKQIFTSILSATAAAREIYYLSATIDLPATGESFICTRGVLKSAKALPDAAKVLQPMSYVIMWESIKPTLS